MKIKTPTWKIIRFTSKTLKDGSSPIMLRVTYDGKRKYYSLGYSVHEEFWNEDHSRIEKKRLSEEDKEVNRQLNAISTRIDKIMRNFEESEFTFYSFDKMFLDHTPLNVYDYLTKIKNEMDEAERFSTAESYRGLKVRLFGSDVKPQKEQPEQKDKKKKEVKRIPPFPGITKELKFRDIDPVFLRKFNDYLLKEDLSSATIGIYFRVLRAAFNRAIKEKIISPELYPFKDFTIKIEPARKFALSDEQITKVKEYKAPKGSRIRNSLNLFLFSYYSYGMNLIDIALLKHERKSKDDDHFIDNGRIYYFRSKTKGMFDLPVNDPLKRIISEYDHTPYIFPILQPGLTFKTIKGRIKSLLNDEVNKDLKIIAKELGLPSDITFYVARHTMASRLYRQGTPMHEIQRIMGHKSIKTTEAYIHSIMNTELDHHQDKL
jgi:integrase/recombinase XerD